MVAARSEPTALSTAAPTYELVDLGPGDAFSINDNGEILGFTNFPLSNCGTSSCLAVWTSSASSASVSSPTTLPALKPGYLDSPGLVTNGVGAQSLNDAGQVVGEADSATDDEASILAFMWDPSAGISEIGPSNPGGEEMAAIAVNNNGQVVGFTYSSSDGTYVGSWLWSNGSSQPLPLVPLPDGSYVLLPAAINDAGTIVGSIATMSADIPYTNVVGGGSDGYSPLTPSDAGLNPSETSEVYPSDINDNGDVVGNGWFDGPDLTGTLLGPWPVSEGYAFNADAINNAEQIVGWSYCPAGTPGCADIESDFGAAVFWENGQAYELNSVIPAGSPLLLSRAQSINQCGEIVGEAYDSNGDAHGFLLIPTGAAANACQPKITISSPAAGAKYTQNTPVAASYSCAPVAGASLNACQGQLANGALVNTSALGSHTFSVMATDSRGFQATKTATYTVVAPPTISIASPTPGAKYTQQQMVKASYTCTAAAGATLTSCAGPVPSGQAINTKTLGAHTFTVTASDNLGGKATRSVSYTVVAEPAPVISDLTQSHVSWREGHDLAQIANAAGGTAKPVGTTFSFKLNEAASLKLSFARKRPSGGQPVTASLSIQAPAGRDKLHFEGRISAARTLALGTYTVTFTATNSAGKRSKSVKLTFAIVG